MGVFFSAAPHCVHTGTTHEVRIGNTQAAQSTYPGQIALDRNFRLYVDLSRTIDVEKLLSQVSVRERELSTFAPRYTAAGMLNEPYRFAPSKHENEDMNRGGE